jgi:type II secretory pathway pseudopilin PulG
MDYLFPMGRQLPRCIKGVGYMNSGIKKNKKVLGFTLIELVIAVGVLALATGALFGTFAFGMQQSFRASRRTAASIEAQLQMERIVGRSMDCLNDLTAGGIPWGSNMPSTCGSFNVVMTYTHHHTSQRSVNYPSGHPQHDPDFPPANGVLDSGEVPILIEVRVAVFERGAGGVSGDRMITHGNIINVSGGLL